MPEPDPNPSPEDAAADDATSRPEPLAPGVYVEEVKTATKPIAGVETSTAALVGQTARGPAGAAPVAITSLIEFQNIYGGPAESLRGASQNNYLWSAARAFFDNGGKRLYIARVAGDGGAPPAASDYRTALSTLEGVSDVSVVAAPGAMVAGAAKSAAVAPIHAELIAHVSRPGAYKFAVLDPPPACSIGDVQAIRAQIDSSYAAIYYPWVLVENPVKQAAGAPAQIALPPSGFICGIYARVDTQRGVFKAPANEAITGAAGFEKMLADSDSDTLNSLGINCLRSFAGRGNRVWGARTASSDLQWKYVSIRRYLIYLEESIDRGTQWVVFEPNGESLWASVRQTVSNFLYNEWRNGALLGSKPEVAFFVKCDRTTMTQNDLDDGRLICIVGVAALKPAEFVIFRIGQKTAGTTSCP